MNKKEITFLVIASSQQARIFEKIGDKNHLNLISEVTAELDSNHEKPGRTFGSMNSLRHGIEPRTDRREVERHKFAKQIFETLLELEKEKTADKLILVASHKMLPEIEQALNAPLTQKVSQKLAKDLDKFTDAEVTEYLKNNLV